MFTLTPEIYEKMDAKSQRLIRRVATNKPVSIMDCIYLQTDREVKQHPELLAKIEKLTKAITAKTLAAVNKKSKK